MDIQRLDYHHYLPIFFEGLSESEFPYKFLARQGIMDMVEKCPEKVFACIPQLIIPIKGEFRV